MRRPAIHLRPLVAALLLPLLGAAAGAAETRPAPAPRPAATGKERLSDKASDQQRVNDCGVPPERRGPRPVTDCPR